MMATAGGACSMYLILAESYSVIEAFAQAGRHQGWSFPSTWRLLSSLVYSRLHSAVLMPGAAKKQCFNFSLLSRKKQNLTFPMNPINAFCIL